MECCLELNYWHFLSVLLTDWRVWMSGNAGGTRAGAGTQYFPQWLFTTCHSSYRSGWVQHACRRQMCWSECAYLLLRGIAPISGQIVSLNTADEWFFYGCLNMCPLVGCGKTELQNILLWTLSLFCDWIMHFIKWTEKHFEEQPLKIIVPVSHFIKLVANYEIPDFIFWWVMLATTGWMEWWTQRSFHYYKALCSAFY